MKKETNQTTTFAVRIDDDVQTITKKPAIFKNGLFQAILIVALTISSLFVCMSFIELEFMKTGAIFFCILLTTLLCLPKSKIPAIAVYAIWALIVYKFYDSIKRGFAIIVIELLSIYKLASSDDILHIAEGHDSLSDKQSVSLTIFAAISILVLVLYVSVYLKNNFMLTFLFTFPLPEIGLYNGVAPDYFWAFVLIAGWLCVFTVQLCDYQENSRTNDSDFTPNKKRTKFYLTSGEAKRSAYGQLSAAICVVVAIALCVSIIGSSLAGYKRSREVDIIRNHLGRDFSLESLFAAFDEIKGIDLGIDLGFDLNIGPGVSVESDADSVFNPDSYAQTFGGMSMGSLLGNNSISYSGQTMLVVDSAMPLRNTIYLKGFSSGNYHNSRWEDVSNEFATYLDESNWLGEGISPDASHYNFPAEYSTHFITAEKVVDKFGSKLTLVPMSIKDVTGTSGLLFTPYFTRRIDNAEYSIVFDRYMRTPESTSQVISYLEESKGATELYLETESYDNLDIIPILFEYIETYPESGMTPSEHLSQAGFFRNYQLGKATVEYMIYFLSISDDFYTEEPQDGGGWATVIKPAGYSYGLASDLYTIYGFDTADLSSPIVRYREGVGNSSTDNEIITLEEFINTFYTQYFSGDLKDSLEENNYFGISDKNFYLDYLLCHSEYLDVDVEINDRVINYINESVDKRNYKEVISALKKYFETNYSYSLDVKPTPDGEDFVEYFLNEMDAGSCTYFASSAVQILRYYGIPARYAEGFAFTPKNGVEVDGRYYYSVPDYAAHAWVEYYDFELGWLPLEFTVSDNEPQSNNTDTNTTTTTTTTTTPTTTTTSTPSQQLPPHQSTTPVQSNTPSQTVTSAGSVNNTKDTDYSFILIIVFILCIIGIIVLGYVYLRNRKLKELDDEISSDNANKNAIGLYRQALEYLRFFGIEASGNITDSVHAKRLYDILSQSELSELNGSIEEVCELAQIAKLSNEMLTEDDIAPLRKFHGDVKASVFERLSRFGKLRARFISMLYK